MSKLADKAVADKQTTTSHSRATAQRLTPADPGFDWTKARQAAEMLLDIRKDITLGPDLTIKDLLNEGRR